MHDIIDIEEILIPIISDRLKSLRGITKKLKIPPELISNGQVPAINHIENRKNPKSRNFISETLLDDYSNFFKIEKETLIFGTDKEIEPMLARIFSNIFWDIKLNSHIYSDEIRGALSKFFYIFADFGRWYEIRRFNPIENDGEIDFRSMFDIFWKLTKNIIILSFKKLVITEIFNQPDGKFKFNRINFIFNKWYRNEFSNVIIVGAMKKLKTDSIFKIGFMVKELLSEFYVPNLSISYAEDIPLEEFFLPIKSYNFHLSGNENPEEIDKIVEEMFKFFSTKKTIVTKEDIEEMDKAKFFEGVNSVIDNSKPFREEIKRVSAEKFLNNVLATPVLFDTIHRLNEKERKIPGILTINSQASRLFQVKVNNVVLKQIDDLVRFQNIFINLIKREELYDYL